MKHFACILALGLVTCGTELSARKGDDSLLTAQLPETASLLKKPAATEGFHAELELPTAALLPEISAPDEAQGIDSEKKDSAVVLKRMVVHEPKLPDFGPAHEPFLQKFLRTGLLAQHVGKKVTTQIELRSTGLIPVVGFSITW